MAAPVRILHVHSTFSLGGKEARAARLMNAFGGAARHVVLSGVAGALSAREAVDRDIVVAYPDDHPALVGRPSIARYRALARYMRGFDLVLTYNWGAIDAVAARRLCGGPPLVHHEDGFNADEIAAQKPARIWFRRAMLPAAARLVVPSETLERIARETWRQPPARIARIANGIDLARFGAAPDRSLIAGLDGRAVIGTIAGLRAVKNLPRLVRAFAAARIDAQLVIVGQGPERDAIAALAADLGVADRVLMPGFIADAARYIGCFDIFALSSDSEQQPIALIEAMAAGLPVVATNVGDVGAMLPADVGNMVVPPADEGMFADALRRLIEQPARRRATSEANASHARATFDAQAMIARYAALYAEAIGRPGSFMPN